jgi:hypothetical protein
MRRHPKARAARLAAAAVAMALLTAAPRWTPDEKKDGAPAQGRISIYSVAPGRQLDFLKWMAQQEEVAKEAGIPAVQLFTHLDGDRWDYLAIWPLTTPDQDKKADEVAARKGFKTGFPAALAFRDLLASHTDTYVAGPTTAAALLAQASR